MDRFDIDWSVPLLVILRQIDFFLVTLDYFGFGG